MSMEVASNDRKTPVRQRLGAKLKQALDNMALQGMRWQDAARAADYPTASMWKALQERHIIAYLTKQRQVFRASLVDRATFRMIDLMEQDDNKAAAFSATSKLMSESDQEHSSATQRAAPGLVVQIINSHALPNATVIEPNHTQVIDVAHDGDK